MKNVFYVLKIFIFLPWLFNHVGKRLGNKAKANFNLYDVTDLTINNYNTHIVHISRSKDNPAMKFGLLIGYSMNRMNE